MNAQFRLDKDRCFFMLALKGLFTVTLVHVTRSVISPLFFWVSEIRTRGISAALAAHSAPRYIPTLQFWRKSIERFLCLGSPAAPCLKAHRAGCRRPSRRHEPSPLGKACHKYVVGPLVGQYRWQPVPHFCVQKRRNHPSGLWASPSRRRCDRRSIPHPASL